MSSHHFVKEQQEPALLILETEHFRLKDIQTLLEWVPVVMVSQETFEAVNSWGIKIDVILAGAKFLEDNWELLAAQNPLHTVIANENQYLEEARRYLMDNLQKNVNIVGLDHQRVLDMEGPFQFLEVVVFDGPLRYFPVKGGHFKKWYARGSIQLHAKENTLIEVKTADKSDIVSVVHATFIEMEEGWLELNARGDFWVGEYY